MPGENQIQGLGDGWREWGHHVLQSLKRLEEGQASLGAAVNLHLAEQDRDIEHVRLEVAKIKNSSAFSKGRLAGLIASIGMAGTGFFFVLSKIWPTHK